jgi:hypothetical protein
MPDAGRVVTLGNSQVGRCVTRTDPGLEQQGYQRPPAGCICTRQESPTLVQFGPLLDLLAHEEKPQVRQYAIKALARIKHPSARPELEKISLDVREASYNRSAARNALVELQQATRDIQDGEPVNGLSGASDSVAAFLSKNHPRPLNGPWQCGWALDFHSRFNGGEWRRSTVGDLTFRLKI